jgi:predicted transcriptional regulator
MKRTTLFIDPQLERELQALARRDGRPMAALVREAVAQYVAAARDKGRTRPGFIATGRSGRADVADRHEELLFDATPPSAPRSRPKPLRPAAPRRRRPA